MALLALKETWAPSRGREDQRDPLLPPPIFLCVSLLFFLFITLNDFIFFFLKDKVSGSIG